MSYTTSKNQTNIAVNIKNLQTILFNCYTRDLCYPKISEEWSENNKCFGMCAITTLIVNDYIGGKIGKIYADSISHYFNIVNDEIVDLTAKQFNHPVDYSNYQLVQREYMLADVNTHKRYKMLKGRLLTLKRSLF